MKPDIQTLFGSAAAELGITLSEETIQKFDTFMNDMIETNKVMNLTAITEPSEIILKHFVDSLTLLKYADLKEGARLADIGCGAGFPGIPIKLVRPDIQLCAIDSLNKRIQFILAEFDKLGLSGCEARHSRAEEACRKPELREAFDVVTARAVAKLNALAELCLPLVKLGGLFCAMKGAACEEEDARRAVALLGGEIEQVHEFTLPQSDMKRRIVIIRKVKNTPSDYPRQTVQISEKPL